MIRAGLRVPDDDWPPSWKPPVDVRFFKSIVIAVLLSVVLFAWVGIILLDHASR